MHRSKHFQSVSYAEFTLHDFQSHQITVVFTLPPGVVAAVFTLHDGSATGGYTLHDFTLGRIVKFWFHNQKYVRSDREIMQGHADIVV